MVRPAQWPILVHCETTTSLVAQSSASTHARNPATSTILFGNATIALYSDIVGRCGGRPTSSLQLILFSSFSTTFRVQHCVDRRAAVYSKPTARSNGGGAASTHCVAAHSNLFLSCHKRPEVIGVVVQTDGRHRATRSRIQGSYHTPWKKRRHMRPQTAMR